MADAFPIVIARDALDRYPLGGGAAKPLELLHLFKKQFPDRADLAEIEKSILRFDAIYCQLQFLSELLSELIAQGDRSGITRNEKILRGQKKVSIQKMKLLDGLDNDGITDARRNLVMMAVELSECGLVVLH